MPRRFRLSVHRKNEFRKRQQEKQLCTSLPEATVVNSMSTDVDERMDDGNFDVLLQSVQDCSCLPEGIVT
jgi:hypothetical protein